MTRRIDELLEAGAVNGDVPGVVACATTGDGQSYEGAFGKRVLGQPADMTPDTVFWIASMTKAIASTAAVQLVEQGKLALDSPAKEILPEIGDAQVLSGFDEDGQPRLRAPKGDITLRHLLTHTAGFSYEMWNPDIPRYARAIGLPPTNSGAKAMLNTPLLFDPGDRWEYGINIDWAGLMVEAASGQKLGAYLRDHLLRSFGHGRHVFQDLSHHATAPRQSSPQVGGWVLAAEPGNGAAAGTGVRARRPRSL